MHVSNTFTGKYTTVRCTVSCELRKTHLSFFFSLLIYDVALFCNVSCFQSKQYIQLEIMLAGILFYA